MAVEHIIIAVNHFQSLALLETGDTIPIVSYCDEDGDTEFDSAVTFIAGPTDDGKWLCDLISSFSDTKIKH